MKKSITLVACFIIIAFSASAQTTVHLKPGPIIGEDAYILKLESNCIPNGHPSTPADVNYGNHEELDIAAWTWNYVGCDNGNIRTFIRFSGIDSIPSNATISNATLKLKTPSSMSTYSPYVGNSDYPNSNNPTIPVG